MMDGFTFSDAPVLLPSSYDATTDTFKYENMTFCSPACVKGWVFKDVSIHSDKINLVSLYFHKVLGITGVVGICPDPQFIQDYMLTDKEKGISIEEFRKDNEQYIYATKTKHINPSSINTDRQLQQVDKNAGCLNDDTYTSAEQTDTVMEM
jgi:hypothetical protein